jgi:hypothetical protein
MDRRPLLVSDVLLRQNPNAVHEWQKRVILQGDDADKVRGGESSMHTHTRTHIYVYIQTHIYIPMRCVCT